MSQKATFALNTEVPLLLLQAIAEVSEEGVLRGLTSLQAAEFLYETSLFPDRVYTFKHALTHEVAYGSLLHERRRVLHARIVEVLESLASDRMDDQVEQWAHHALRGETWDKAVTYCRQAGMKALAHLAHREAALRFEQALEALQYVPESRRALELSIDLRFDLRAALLTTEGNVNRPLTILREAEHIAEVIEDPYRLARVSALLTIWFVLAGDYEQAILRGERALALANDLGDFAVQIDSRVGLGMAYFAIDADDKAVAALKWVISSLTGEQTHARFDTVYLPSVLSRYYLSWWLAERGRFEESLQYTEDAISIAESINRPIDITLAYRGIGFVHLQRGNLDTAIRLLESGLMFCAGAALPNVTRQIEALLGYAHALAGRHADALRLLEQTIEGIVADGRVIRRAVFVTRLGEAYLLAGRIPDAITHARRALKFAQELHHIDDQAYALRLLGDIAMHCDSLETDQAETHYRQALVLADELSMRPLQAHCHHGLGTLYRQTGQSEPARAELSTAIDMYREMAMTFWIPQAQATLAEVERR